MITKKYNELDSYIPTLKPGTYDLTVDCTGVAADQFIGTQETNYYSPFTNKLKTAKDGVLFNLKPININSDITATNYMFNSCNGLTSIDCSVFTNITDASYMFYDCSGLTSIDTSAFTKVTNASYMFYNCTGLTLIDISAFTNVTDARYMLKNCTSLSEIIWGNIKPTTNTNMFDGISTNKILKILNQDTIDWLSANASNMKLINYTTEKIFIKILKEKALVINNFFQEGAKKIEIGFSKIKCKELFEIAGIYNYKIAVSRENAKKLVGTSTSNITWKDDDFNEPKTNIWKPNRIIIITVKVNDSSGDIYVGYNKIIDQTHTIPIHTYYITKNLNNLAAGCLTNDGLLLFNEFKEI